MARVKVCMICGREEASGECCIKRGKVEEVVGKKCGVDDMKKEANEVLGEITDLLDEARSVLPGMDYERMRDDALEGAWKKTMDSEEEIKKNTILCFETYCDAVDKQEKRMKLVELIGKVVVETGKMEYSWIVEKELERKCLPAVRMCVKKGGHMNWVKEAGMRYCLEKDAWMMMNLGMFNEALDVAEDYKVKRAAMNGVKAMNGDADGA